MEKNKTILAARCYIHEVGRFLKNVCDIPLREDLKHFGMYQEIIPMKCVNSDQIYHNFEIYTPFRYLIFDTL
jgi:hypothetical protein